MLIPRVVCVFFREKKADNTNTMVQMLFFLRFRAQLRRTWPELVPRLEDVVTRAVERAGGKIAGERRLLKASFDERSLGFWLDMLILIETVTRGMDAAAADIYGYSLVLGRNLFNAGEPPQTPEALCRFLAGGSRGGGVFLDRAAREGLSPYALVEEPKSWTRSWAAQRNAAHTGRFRIGDFCRLDGLKDFSAPNKAPVHGAAPAAKRDHSLRESVIRSLTGERAHAERKEKAHNRNGRRNTLILGPAFAGKREGLYQYRAGIAGDFPPLLIRFGSGGLNALTDAWSPPVRAMAAAGAADAEEINRIWELLFRERLRDELSPFIIKKARRFFILLLEFYTSAARRKGRAPVIVLENIHRAEQTASDLFIGAYAGIRNMPDLLVLGTGDEPAHERLPEEALKKWEKVFHRMIRPAAREVPMPRLPEMPEELWEIAYALSLFGRYFPASLFLRLFEEGGKNPAMVSRALSLLSVLGIIDTPEDCRPWMDDFAASAGAALGEHGERARALVRGRLLDWVEQKKLSPCFRFLLIIADLGGGKHLDDQLILKSISSDMINGTASGLERARNNGLLETIAGPERAIAVRYIVETTRALLAGDAGAIRAAFREPPPDCAAFPVLKARMLVNCSAWHLGQRDNAAALETVKEAIILSQGKNSLCLAQSYRLFSLVSLSKQQSGETIDYLGFAMENAEKFGDYQELGISAYYAAAAQFLFGNISRAIHLARKAREQALNSGCGEWADRACFLEGRLVFETGRYREALDIFESLRGDSLGEDTAAGTPGAEKQRLLAAWAYRARVYFQNPLTPKPADGGQDADLFEVEAAYLAGNYHKTVELAGAFTSPRGEENFLYTEQPDWRSGFAQCELFYFSRGELWDRMICAYHSLALCRLSAAGGEEAMHNMQRILKNEQLSEMDPWDAFYFYAWYRVLEQTGAGQVDMNTAVSMAFKRLQRRASRIDDVEIRRQFLFQPRWNSALSLAAREFKLI